MSAPIERFDDLALSPALLETLKGIGYEAPSPIQAATIPPVSYTHLDVYKRQTNPQDRNLSGKSVDHRQRHPGLVRGAGSG